ncbi:MAG: hypothetical protein GZ087_03550 [Flavobacterium sp.]|nr:hypothetical protein [Flavobacterium sp.]
MKTIIGISLLFIITTISYSQNMTEGTSNEKSANKVASTEVVTKGSGNKMSIYLRDISVDPRVATVQKAFIESDLGKNVKDFDYFMVSLELNNGSGRLDATYNAKGKLTSVVEVYKNVQLPISICRSIYKEYPGWQIVKDKYKFIQENGTIVKKEYILTMKKDNKTQKITVNPVGAILASR